MPVNYNRKKSERVQERIGVLNDITQNLHCWFCTENQNQNMPECISSSWYKSICYQQNIHPETSWCFKTIEKKKKERKDLRLKAAEMCSFNVPVTLQKYAQKVTGTGGVFHVRFIYNNKQSKSKAVGENWVQEQEEKKAVTCYYLTPSQPVRLSVSGRWEKSRKSKDFPVISEQNLRHLHCEITTLFWTFLCVCGGRGGGGGRLLVLLLFCNAVFCATTYP